LRRATGRDDQRLGFTPVLVPMSRGILAVCTAPVSEGTTTEDLLAALAADYAEEHFVTVLPEGVFPTTDEVAGANTLRLGAVLDRRRRQATVISSLHTLVKCTAGAAIQSLNLALGMPEVSGLSRTALAPCPLPSARRSAARTPRPPRADAS